MEPNTALKPIIERFCDGLQEKVTEIAGCLEQLAEGGEQGFSKFENALDLVHQISGLAGTVGYALLSEKAAALERLMRSASSTGTLDAALFCEVRSDFEGLKALALSLTPEMSTLYHVDLRQFAAVAR